MVSGKKKFDHIRIGAIAGLVAPLLILVAVRYFRYSQINFGEFFVEMWNMKLLIKILSLCAFPNLGLFFIFIRTNRMQSAKGVLLATFIYAFVVMFYRLFAQ